MHNDLQHHFQALSEPQLYDPEEHGYLVIAEPGDSVAALESETGCPIVSDWFQETHYGDEDFAPAYDWLDNQALNYALAYTVNDSGYTILIIVPKLTGIDERLLAVCRD